MQKLLSKFKPVLYFLVLTIVLFIPLFMKFPMAIPKGAFVAIRLEDILIFGTLGMWFLYIILTKNFKEFFKDTLNLSIFLFFFIGALSLISAIFLSHTVTPYIGLLHFLRRIEMLLLLPLGIWVARNKDNLNIYLISLCVVIFLVNFYALGQRYLSFPSISTTNEELSKGLIRYLTPVDRINSTFSGHYDLAVFLMMSITALITFVFYFIDSKKIQAKKFEILNLIILSTFSFVVLVMTAARLSFVATILAVFFTLILLKKRKLILIAIILCVLFLIFPTQLRNRLVSTITVNIQKDWKSYFAVNEKQAKRSTLNIPTLPIDGKRPENIGTVAPDIAPGEPTDTTELGVYRSFDIRIRVEWPRALRSFIKNPFLGTGYSSLGLATDNDFLRSMGEVGILGTIAFLYIIVILIRKYVTILKKAKNFEYYLSVGILSMVFAFLINSLFIDVFEASKVAFLFWLINGFVYGRLTKV